MYNDYQGQLAKERELPDIGGRLSLRQQVELDLKKAEERVKRSQELLSLLDKNPEIQRVLELLGSR